MLLSFTDEQHFMEELLLSKLVWISTVACDIQLKFLIATSHVSLTFVPLVYR